MESERKKKKHKEETEEKKKHKAESVFDVATMDHARDDAFVLRLMQKTKTLTSPCDRDVNNAWLRGTFRLTCYLFCMFSAKKS